MFKRLILSFCFCLHLIKNHVSAQKDPLSVHVLDNLFGGNAANMTCKLYMLQEDDFVHLSTQFTDKNGRILEFIPLEEYNPGIYRIWFATKEYYNRHNVSTFFPALQITFNIKNTLKEYHIPLLLSPFGFVTYKGS